MAAASTPRRTSTDQPFQLWVVVRIRPGKADVAHHVAAVQGDTREDVEAKAATKLHELVQLLSPAVGTITDDQVAASVPDEPKWLANLRGRHDRPFESSVEVAAMARPASVRP